MVPDFLHEAPPTDACAAFIKESRMKFVNARKLDRKSGCTLGRTGAPVQGSRLRCLLKVGRNYSKSYVGRYITGRMEFLVLPLLAYYVPAGDSPPLSPRVGQNPPYTAAHLSGLARVVLSRRPPL